MFCVDTSPDMNEINRLITLEGKSATHALPAGTFMRMHLPASNDVRIMKGEMLLSKVERRESYERRNVAKVCLADGLRV